MVKGPGVGAKTGLTSGFVSMFRPFDRLKASQSQGPVSTGWNENTHSEKEGSP